MDLQVVGGLTCTGIYLVSVGVSIDCRQTVTMCDPTICLFSLPVKLHVNFELGLKENYGLMGAII